MLGNEQKIRLLPGDKVQKGKKMKLYIIRHGETSWNKQKKLQGQRDIMLNDAGIRLAELTGEGMKDIDFDLVISSPLIRTQWREAEPGVLFQESVRRGGKLRAEITKNKSVRA